MFIRQFNIVIILCNFYTIQGKAFDTYYSINGKHALHQVSEKFLSLSIDPADLLAGINLSDTALLLVQNLSPAYIRIAGPSTKSIKYVDNEFYVEDDLPDDGDNIVVTPFMWFGVNEWLKQANLTPVFGISDVETTGGFWDPKSTVPLLEISDKLNVSCYWMLGFDSSKKNETQYKEDLRTLRHILAAFPEQNNTWKIVASDISSFPIDRTQNIVDDLKDVVTAVTWEKNTTQESFPEKSSALKLVNSQNQSPVKIWTSCPKSSQPTSFSSALLWANQVGIAAKLGYDVVFRQPNSHELFSDTPVYWFSLLHKRLMGNKVLDVEPRSPLSNCSIYAHCARNQNEHKEKKGMTIMVVNNNTDSHTVKVRLEQFPFSRFMEIESYILTSPEENSTDIFLNGERLTPECLSNENSLQPEVTVLKLKTHVPLKVPPMSIGFFVLPKATTTVYSSEESENSLHPEKTADEGVSASEEDLTVQQRGLFKKHPNSEELKNKMSNIELIKLNDLKQRINFQLEDSTTDSSSGKYNSEEAKFHEKSMQEMMNRREELRESIFGKTNQGESNSEYLSEETERIIRDRAMAKALQKNVILTDDELDLIMEAVRRKYARYMHSSPTKEFTICNNHDANIESLESSYQESLSSQPFNNFERSRKARDVNMKLLNLRSKIEEKRQRLEERMSDVVGNTQTLKQNIKDKIYKLKHNGHRFKRDINMELLKIKTEEQKKAEKEATNKKYKTVFKNKEVKKTAFRKPGTSDELLTEFDEHSAEEITPKTDAFAEFSIPEKSEEKSREFPKKKISLFEKKQKFKGFTTAKPTKINFRKNEPKEMDESGTKSSDELNDFEEHLPCIYEYFEPQDKKLKEIDLVGQTQKKSKKQNVVKTKMIDSAADSMEYLRKKRSHADIGKGIKEKGAINYDAIKKAIISKLMDDSHISKLGLITESIGKDKNHNQSKVGLLTEGGDEDKNHSNSKVDLVTEGGDDDKNHSNLKVDLVTEGGDEDKSHNNSKADLITEGGDEQQTSVDKPELNQNHKAKLVDAVLAKENAKLENLSKIKLDPFKNIFNIDNLDDLITESALALKDVISITTAIAEAKLDKFQDKLKLKQKRRRRSIGDGNRDKIMPMYKVHIKKQLRDPQEDEDTESREVKMEMLENKKGKDRNEFAKVLDVTPNGNNKPEKEKRKELHEKIKSLREKLTNKKKDVDKLLVSQVKLQKKLAEGERGLAKEMSKNRNEMKIKNSKTRKYKITPRLADSLTNENEHSTPPVHVAKRSLLEQKYGLFGNYKPLTTDLKVWQPVDILTLKRDTNFLSPPVLRPVADYHLFRNVLAPNKYFNFRRKRHTLDDNLNSLDRDAYLNDIEKNAISTFSTEQEREGDNKNSAQGTRKEEKQGAVVKPILQPIFAKQIETASDNNMDAETVPDNNLVISNRVSDNIQRIPTRHEQSLIDNLINKMSGLFTNIGGAFGKYIRS